MRSMLLLAIAAIGCAAPPMGVGSGALRRPSAGGAASGTIGLGGDVHRQVFQAEATVNVMPRRWGGLETGFMYVRLADDRPGQRPIDATSAFPYVRPRLAIGSFSIATALTGFGFGGGGGGIVGGIADLQVGWGGERWSVYGGAYAHYYELTGSAETSSRQLRVGGEYVVFVRTVRLTAAAELYRHSDRIGQRVGDRDTGTFEVTRARFFGAGIKLRIESPWLDWK
jgi:hypothetical protein